MTTFASRNNRSPRLKAVRINRFVRAKACFRVCGALAILSLRAGASTNEPDFIGLNPPLIYNQPSLRPATPAVPVTNVTFSWTCSTNWLAGEPALFCGTGTNRVALNVAAFLTNLVTGLAPVSITRAGVAMPVMPYQHSNSQSVPITAGSGLFRVYYGVKTK